MSQWAIFIQEGFGTDGHAVYFTNDAPVYEAIQVPVVAVIGDEKIQVGEREDTFILFTPLNGPFRQRGKLNRIPFTRVLSIVEQTNEISKTLPKAIRRGGVYLRVRTAQIREQIKHDLAVMLSGGENELTKAIDRNLPNAGEIC